MVAKILSLLNSLKKTYRSRLLKCVSPLLMGAVLSIPLSVSASEVTIDLIGTYSRNISVNSYAYGTNYNAEDINYTNTFQVDYSRNEAYQGEYLMYEFTRVYFDFPYDFVSRQYVYDGETYTSYDYLNLSDITLHIFVNGVEHVLFPQYMNNGTGITGDYPGRYRRVVFAGEESIKIYTNSLERNNISYVYGYISFNQLDPLDKILSDGSRVGFVPISITGQFDYSIYASGFGISDTDINNSTNNLINQGNQEAADRWEEDKSDAEQAGADMTGFATQLDNLKNTWAILWYPIEFTNRFVEVFTGGTQAAAYQDEYTYVTGYRYNDETGFLEPIQSMAAQPQSAGTGITFPSFELMGYTVWDSYTYDLSQVKEQVPEVFDAIYVIVSILEMLWFVAFLRSKYDEVFG